MQNEFQTIPFESDECLTKGICSISPALSSIQEIILLYIKELSFYLTKLKDFGITNDAIKEVVTFALFNILTNAEYKQEQFKDILTKLYDFIVQSKALYEKQCLERNVEIKTTKSYFKYSKSFDLSDAIRKGEKYFLKKSTTFTLEQKNLYDILLFLVKSITIKLIELDRLGKNNDEAYYAILSTLETIGSREFSEARFRDQIKETIEVYYKTLVQVFYSQVERYGQISLTDVSFSAEIGKAILVSGSDFKKLEDVLEATKDKGINIYTHGLEMLMAHSFKKFRTYPHLRGHFGSSVESSIVDFATFPGAILMTKGTLQRIEYLFRGKLFTLDPIPPVGVVQIKDNNYEPLINSTLNSKGFTHEQKKSSIKVGFDINLIHKRIDDVVDKIIDKKIKNLYIVGLTNYTEKCPQYFEQFFKLLPKDSFAFSLNYDIDKENVYHQSSFCDYTLFYKILKRINKKKPLNEINITTFITKCDKNTIANLLYLKQIGIKNVYTCKCPTTLINPMVMKTLEDSFDIKEFSNPQKDINDTLKD